MVVAADRKNSTKQQNPDISKLRLRYVPAYILMGLLLFGLMFGQNLSGDVWWHLKTGQWIVQHHAFPFNDPFSFTARSPIILHEWGAEIIEWLVYSILSPSALAAMAVMLISGAFLIAFKLAINRSGRLFSAFVATAAGAAASAGASEMRPQVFSLLLFAILVWILHRYHNHGGRLIWLLAPVTLLWANLHGAFIIGLVLIAMETVIAFIVPPDWSKEKRLPRIAAALPLAIVGLISALLGLINPNGKELYLYPIHVVGNAGTTRLIAEWTSPSFHEMTGRSLMVFMGLAAIGLAFMRRPPKLRDSIYVVFFAAATLLSRRQAVLFAIACAGPVACWLSSAQDETARWLSEYRMRTVVNKAVWGVLILLILVLCIWRISDVNGRNPFDYMNKTEVFPLEACDYILASDISGPMFNDYNYGGYLIWRLWPKYKDFIDGRTEPFLNGAFEDSNAALNCAGPGTWQAIFDKYHINFAVLNPGVPLASVLADRADWACVYADKKAVVFVRKTTAKNAQPR